MRDKGSSCRWLVPAVAVVLFSIGSSAHASVLFSNLNPNPLSKYNSGSSWIIQGAGAGTYFAQGFSFTPSATEGLSQVDIALSAVTGNDLVVVTLNADSAGLPGGVLETWNVSGLPAFGTCCVLQTLLPAVPLTLTFGTTYWLVATPGATDTSAGWNVNNTGSTGPRAIQFSPGGEFSIFGANDDRGAFDVIGTAAVVPEPATVTFAAAGLALLAAVRLRRKS
jgi:hypothetical protein